MGLDGFEDKVCFADVAGNFQMIANGYFPFYFQLVLKCFLI